MDKRDAVLLQALQSDGRQTNAALAKLVHLAEAPTWRRVKALEDEKVIQSYRAVLDPRKLGYVVTAFVSIRFSSHDLSLQAAFEEQVQQMDEVLWCHNVSGSVDFLLCVVARSLSEYGDVVSSRLRRLPGVTAIESSFSLRRVKEFTGYPLG
jgi:Lrp/AsnC family transcriptional regulator, leucine-responsive regulatory protein